MTAFPELARLLEVHVDELGELLPTLFLGEVAQWATTQHSEDPARVTHLLSWLEERFQRGDGDVRDAIGVGFVEMLPAQRPGEGGVVDDLGPGLRSVAFDLGVLLDAAEGDR